MLDSGKNYEAASILHSSPDLLAFILERQSILAIVFCDLLVLKHIHVDLAQYVLIQLAAQPALLT
jgi:hypothetical protein